MKRNFRPKLIVMALTTFSFVSCAQLRSGDEAEKEIYNNEYSSEVTQSEADEEYYRDSENQVPFLRKVHNQTVASWVQYFTGKDRERFQRFINNGQQYRPIIDQILSKHGLPRDLFFVGLIESGYNLHVKSKASAVGPWQFIKGTGVRYGLRTNRFVDERRSIFKATEAAALYFKDLYNIFGSWELALSAYNAGENGIIRRIRNSGIRDFYGLSENGYLPAETQNYVPKVLAAMHIFENAEKYGFEINNGSQNIYTDSKAVRINKSVPVQVISDASGLTVSDLKDLNPDLLSGPTPAPTPGLPFFELRIPNSASTTRVVTSVESFNGPIRQQYYADQRKHQHPSSKIQTISKKLAKKESQRQKRVVYLVRPGDSLHKIAKKIGRTVAYVKRASRVNASQLKPGQRLIIEL